MRFFLAMLCVGGLACGGSASETPWPAEPIDLEPGPAGEAPKKGLDTTKLPDNYTKKKKQEAGSQEEETEDEHEDGDDDETIDKEHAPEPHPEDESEDESEDE